MNREEQYRHALKEYHWLRILRCTNTLTADEKQETKQRMKVLERRLDELRPTPTDATSGVAV